MKNSQKIPIKSNKIFSKNFQKPAKLELRSNSYGFSEFFNDSSRIPNSFQTEIVLVRPEKVNQKTIFLKNSFYFSFNDFSFFLESAHKKKKDYDKTW